MIKRFWAFVTGGKLVYLRDFEGEVSTAIARTDPWGALTAYRYLIFKINCCILLPDGKVKQPNYIKDWKIAPPLFKMPERIKRINFFIMVNGKREKIK